MVVNENGPDDGNYDPRLNISTATLSALRLFNHQKRLPPARKRSHEMLMMMEAAKMSRWAVLCDLVDWRCDGRLLMAED